MKLLIQPDIEVEPIQGESLLHALVRYHVPVQNLCNGRGTCGKCKVRIIKGIPEPTEYELRHLQIQEIQQGIRLACRVAPSDGMVVQSGPQSSFDRKESVLSGVEQELEPGLEKILVVVPEPSLDDTRGDWDRFADMIADMIEDFGGTAIGTSYYLVQKVSDNIRTNDCEVTAVLWNGKLIGIDSGNTTGRLYGIALDIGTTSVAAALVDLSQGRVLKVRSRENAQTAYGADVISRISYANMGPAQRHQLRSAILETVNGLVSELLTETGIETRDVYKMTIVGNTTMHHLFLGFDVSGLAVYPFVSSCNSGLEFSAGELGIQVNPQARVLMWPNIASFVGGDTLGAVLGAPQVLGEGNHLLIDLGTNCELFLKAGNAMFACSTAAGPAFEGATITQGMRAKPGAIEGVQMDGDVSIRVIGNNNSATGICGSGLIQAIDQMCARRIISPQGAFQRTSTISPELAKRLRCGRNGAEFVLAYGQGMGTDVVINQKDIRELQLAKAAVCASIKMLLEIAGLTLQDLDSVVLAGTFASYLNPAAIIRIGLIPNIPPEKIETVGNSAHVGALRTLLNHSQYKEAQKLARSIKHIEMGGNKTFNDYFMTFLALEIVDW